MMIFNVEKMKFHRTLRKGAVQAADGVQLPEPPVCWAVQAADGQLPEPPAEMVLIPDGWALQAADLAQLPEPSG